MAKKTNIVAAEPQTLATQLYGIQEQIAILKEREDALKESLLENMKSQAVKTVKLEGGTTFMRAERQTLKVKTGLEDKAEKWADDNNAWKIDTGAALAILRRSLKKMPACFQVNTSEYLVVKHH